MINDIQEELQEEKKYVVYIHTNKINGKKYVGITCQEPPTKRWMNGQGYVESPKFYKAICKYGWDNFSSEIVCKELSRIEALLKEGEYIRKYQTTLDENGYNISEGAMITPLGTIYLGDYHHSENYYMEERTLPTLETIKRSNNGLLEIFSNIIKRGYGFSYSEEKIVIEEVDGKEIYTKEIIPMKAEPNLAAIDLILNFYKDEPELKEVVEDFKKLKEELEEGDE